MELFWKKHGERRGKEGYDVDVRNCEIVVMKS